MKSVALFTGSRDWSDPVPVIRAVKELSLNTVVVHGAARGLDAMVDKYARARGLEVIPCEADWEVLGHDAGPVRNQQMLDDFKPTEGHAFPLPGSTGTWDMVRRLRAARVPVTVHGGVGGDDAIRLMIEAYGEAIDSLSAFDFETYKFTAGMMSPPIVCASTAWVENGEIQGALHDNPREALARYEWAISEGRRVTLAKGSYDLAVAIQHNPELVLKTFRAIREGRVSDILIRQSLDAIYGGHLGKNPDGTEMRKPRSNEVTDRYSLEICTLQNLGRADAKEDDEFRQSYALLAGIPSKRWPPKARVYPISDAKNTLENEIAQVAGSPGHHRWEALPRVPGEDSLLDTIVCSWCGVSMDDATHSHCPSAPWREPHKNAQNVSAQVLADFCLNLNANHAMRTDPEKIAVFEAEVEEKHRVAVERFQKKGWIRADGTEDQAAVKRAIAVAYGATGKCKRCGGGVSCKRCSGRGNDGSGAGCKDCGGLGVLVGKIQKWKLVECRGERKNGRGKYQGCPGDDCKVCHGAGKYERLDSIVTCKHVYDEDDKTVERGCDGTGLDLTTAPFLPRTKNKEHPRREGGVSTERDTAMNSGDDDISDYGENEFEKSRTTYIPYLKKGVDGPLWVRANVLVATGRCSYEDCPVHQFPRAGRERNCIRARGAWCGYPQEMVFGSTDYSAGELCTLAQYTYWLFKYSRMRDIINETGDPGILHSALAAEILGLSLDEFLKRLAAGDKQCKEFRQASKPKNFGAPAGMGSPKIVATNRKKNAGFTVCEGGPHRNAKGQPGYWGIRFCILVAGKKSCGTTKVTTWGKKNTPCAPVCKDCVEVEANILSPAYFKRFPEMTDYHRWATKMTDAKRRVPSLVWDADRARPRIMRERGGCDFSAYCNTPFQSMLADICKDAYCEVTEECFTGVKRDGTPSPLAGSRVPLVLHDEPFSELILDRAHESGPRIADIMIASGKKIAPDVVWKAETALAFWWDKEMSPVHHPVTGQLMPWGPIPDYLQERFAA